MINLVCDDQIKNNYFLAPTGALGEGISCVRACVRPGYYSNNSENEFLQHSEEYRGVLGQERAQGRA